MKKTFSIILLFLIFSNLQAQLSKGTIMLGGSVSGSISSHDESDGSPDFSQSSFEINPSAALFVSDHAAWGLSLGLGSSKYQYEYDTYDDKHISSSLSLRISYRRYFSVGEKIALFLEGGGSYGMGKQKNTTISPSIEDITSNSQFVGISVWPGVNYFINERWAIQAGFGSLGYSNSWSDSNSPSNYPDSKDNYFGFNFGISSLYFGLQYFLKK